MENHSVQDSVQFNHEVYDLIDGLILDYTELEPAVLTGITSEDSALFYNKPRIPLTSENLAQRLKRLSQHQVIDIGWFNNSTRLLFPTLSSQEENRSDNNPNHKLQEKEKGIDETLEIIKGSDGVSLETKIKTEGKSESFRYALTQGGILWEKFFQPKWEYFYNIKPGKNRSTIIIDGPSQENINKIIKLYSHYCDSLKVLDEKQISPYKPYYWKELPTGYEITFVAENIQRRELRQQLFTLKKWRKKWKPRKPGERILLQDAD